MNRQLIIESKIKFAEYTNGLYKLNIDIEDKNELIEQGVQARDVLLWEFENLPEKVKSVWYVDENEEKVLEELKGMYLKVEIEWDDSGELGSLKFSIE